MIAVADTSPLNYLVLIGHIDLLPALLGRILVPASVIRELNHQQRPSETREWANRPPAWAEVLDVEIPLDLARLGEGEAAAIELARMSRADVVLLDDRFGRREAVAHGLRVAGTIAILEEAGRAGLIDFQTAALRLRATTFRISDALWAKMMEPPH